MPGIFYDRLAAQGCCTPDSNDPVVLPAAALPHMKRSVHSLKPLGNRLETACFRCQIAVRLVFERPCEMRVTLKKNLEKLRFANHLSP
jgi:hypothetical protein